MEIDITDTNNECVTTNQPNCEQSDGYYTTEQDISLTNNINTILPVEIITYIFNLFLVMAYSTNSSEDNDYASMLLNDKATNKNNNDYNMYNNILTN